MYDIEYFFCFGFEYRCDEEKCATNATVTFGIMTFEIIKYIIANMKVIVSVRAIIKFLFGFFFMSFTLIFN